MEKTKGMLMLEGTTTKSFKEIFKDVCDTAKINFIRDGFIVPIVQGMCPDRIFIIPVEYTNTEEKITEYKVIEDFLKKNKCYAYIHVSEAFVRKFDKDSKQMFSDVPDRQEAIFVIGEHKDGTYLSKMFELDKETKTIKDSEEEISIDVFQNNLFGNIFGKKYE